MLPSRPKIARIATTYGPSSACLETIQVCQLLPPAIVRTIRHATPATTAGASTSAPRRSLAFQPESPPVSAANTTNGSTSTGAVSLASGSNARISPSATGRFTPGPSSVYAIAAARITSTSASRETRNSVIASDGQITTANAAATRCPAAATNGTSSRSTAPASSANRPMPISCCERGSSPNSENAEEDSRSSSGGGKPVPTRSATSPCTPSPGATSDSPSQTNPSRSGASRTNDASWIRYHASTAATAASVEPAIARGRSSSTAAAAASTRSSVATADIRAWVEYQTRRLRANDFRGVLGHAAAEEARDQAGPPRAAARRARRVRTGRCAARALAARAGRRHPQLPRRAGRSREADAGAAARHGPERGSVDRVAEAGLEGPDRPDRERGARSCARERARRQQGRGDRPGLEWAAPGHSVQGPDLTHYLQAHVRRHAAR